MGVGLRVVVERGLGGWRSCGHGCGWWRILSSLPFRFDEIFKESREGPAAAKAESLRPITHIGVHREVEFLAEMIGGFWFATFASHFTW
jgi:hypothetical protein